MVIPTQSFGFNNIWRKQPALNYLGPAWYFIRNLETLSHFTLANSVCGFYVAFNGFDHMTCTHCARVGSMLSMFEHGARADLLLTRVATWDKLKSNISFACRCTLEGQTLACGTFAASLQNGGLGMVVPEGAVPRVWLS